MKKSLFNISFFIVTIIFFICLIFCANELVEIYGSQNLVISHEHKSEYFIIFMSVLLLTGISIMVLLICAILSLKKINRDTEILNQLANIRMRAIEASREGIAILNKDKNFVYVNEAFFRMYGYNNFDDLHGNSWDMLRSVRERSILNSILSGDLLKTGWWAGHSVGKKKDGEEFPQELSLTLLDDGGIVFIVKDISNYIQKENTMQVIKMAIDSAMDGIFIIDQNHKFVFANSSFFKIYNMNDSQKNEILSLDWRSVYSNTEQNFINSNVLPKAVLKGFWNGQMHVKTQNLNDIYTSLSLTKLPNNLMLGVVRDETQRAALEVEREKIKDQMFQAQKVETITRLIKGMGEDFKSSIFVIKDNIEHAFANDDVPDERRKYMINILTAANNADEKISHLLTLSEGRNVNSGRVDLVDVSLNVTNDMVRKHQMKAKFSIESKIDTAIIFADAEQVKNSLEGLCLNAMESMVGNDGKIFIFVSDGRQYPVSFYEVMESDHDYTHHDLPKLLPHKGGHVSFCGYLRPMNKYFRISVNDNGDGISPDALPNIFDPFFTTKSDGASSGVRLSAIKGMVLSLKGAIAVESVVGKGTSIHLFIPAMPA